MSFGDPNNPYGQQPPQAPYGAPQQPAQYGYPQQPAQYSHPQQAAPGYGYPGQVGMPGPGMPTAFASWGARLGAALLDGLIVGVVPIILGVIPVIIDQRDPIVNLLIGLIAGLYAMVCGIIILVKEGKTGQTPGKKALGIRLVRENDRQVPGFGLALGRRFCHFLDGLPCGLGYLWPLWDEKNQTFADKMVGTVVVRAQ